jgi:hypothetical protein
VPLGEPILLSDEKALLLIAVLLVASAADRLLHGGEKTHRIE